MLMIYNGTNIPVEVSPLLSSFLEKFLDSQKSMISIEQMFKKYCKSSIKCNAVHKILNK